MFFPITKTVRAFAFFVLWVSLADTAAAQFAGRVVVAGAERPDVLVSVVRENGQVIEQAYTSSRGTFRFDNISSADSALGNYLYVVINQEGYKPYRKRIDYVDLRRGAGTFIIFLEPDNTPQVPAAQDGALTVDVSQSDVPEKAAKEYREAVKASDNPKRAIEHLERAVKLAPDYYDAWINLGGQYDRAGRSEDAIKAYLNANEANPRGALAALNLGALYYAQGDRERTQAGDQAQQTYAEARQWLEQSIALDPMSARAHFYLGATLFRLNLLEESEEMLQSVFALQKDYPQARLMLINVYSRQNRYQDALDQATAFLNENPRDPNRKTIERVKSQLEGALKR